jgi:hypothetical protein
VAVLCLDTSAAGRVLLGEPDAPAILRDIGAFTQRVASRRLCVELRRLALREGRLQDADQLLAGVTLLPLDDELLAQPVAIATLDAIHLVTALRLSSAGHLHAVMTYTAGSPTVRGGTA